MADEKEIRACAEDLRFQEKDGARKLAGYAAVFDSESVDMIYFKEQIAPGAFTRTLKENGDVRALVNHDTGKVLARTKSGSMTMREDTHGLFVEISPADTSYGRDISELVKRGDVDGMSIGFRVKEDKWSIRDGKDFRTLLDIELHEVSIVAFPAYTTTSISARSAERVYREYCSRHYITNAIRRNLVLFEKHIAHRRKSL